MLVAWSIPACVLVPSCLDGARRAEPGVARPRPVVATSPALEPLVRCEDLSGLRIPHVTITEARVVAAAAGPQSDAPSLPPGSRPSSTRTRRISARS
jgi:hypothetical protein